MLVLTAHGCATTVFHANVMWLRWFAGIEIISSMHIPVLYTTLIRLFKQV